MASNLDLIVSAQDQASATLKKVEGNMNALTSTAKSSSSTFSKFSGVATTVASGFAAVGAALATAGGFALRESAKFENLEARFQVLLGTTEAAKQRMKELNQFALVTPYQVDEVAKASAILQTFGGTALATGEGLRFVGDMAAFAQQPINEVAVHAGRIVDSLKSGRPFGESAMRLQELGLISGAARANFEAMAGKTMSTADAMAFLRKNVTNVDGTMRILNDTLGGQFSNVQQQFIEKVKQVGDELVKTFDLKGKMTAFADAISKIDMTPMTNAIKVVYGIIGDFVAFGQAQFKKFTDFFNSEMGGRFFNLMKSIWDFIWKNIIPYVGKIFDRITTIVVNLLKDIAPVLEALWKIFKFAFDVIAATVLFVVDNVVIPLLDSLGSALGDAGSVANVVLDAMAWAWEEFSKVVSGMIDDIVEIYNWFAEKTSWIFGNVRAEAASTAAGIQAMGDPIGKGISFAGQKLQEGLNFMKPVFGAMTEASNKNDASINKDQNSIGGGAGGAAKTHKSAIDTMIADIQKLGEKYDAAVSKVREKISDLNKDLASLIGDFSKQESEDRMKVGEAIVENENKIVKLKQDIAEKNREIIKDTSGDSYMSKQQELSDLQSQLAAEQSARMTNAALIKQFDVEATEAKRQSKLTELESALENFRKERAEATIAFKEKLANIKEELREQRGARDEVLKIAKEKEDALVKGMKNVTGDLKIQLAQQYEDVKFQTQRMLDEYANLANVLGSTGRAINGTGTPTPAPKTIKKADGGFVPGIGNSDTVPAMLTPGELILNRAQQRNLAGNMNGQNITINISGVFGSDAAGELGDMIVNRLKLVSSI